MTTARLSYGKAKLRKTVRTVRAREQPNIKEIIILEIKNEVRFNFKKPYVHNTLFSRMS